MQSKPKLVLFGANGRLGQQLAQSLSGSYRVACPSRAECDLQQAEQLKHYLQQQQPQVLVNAAAMSVLGHCAAAPLQAHAINTLAPQIMGWYAHNYQAKLLHFSTDYVLDGRHQGLKSVQAKTQALNVYAESKLEAEQRLLQQSEQHAAILRVCWLFGNPLRPSFGEQTLAKLQQGCRELQAVSDKFSMPTSVQQVAGVAAAMAAMPAQQIAGIWHVCSSGEPVSWFDYCRHIIDLYEKQYAAAGWQRPDLQPIPLKKLNADGQQRPLHTAMDNSKLAQLGLALPLHWQTDLQLNLALPNG